MPTMQCRCTDGACCVNDLPPGGDKSEAGCVVDNMFEVARSKVTLSVRSRLYSWFDV